MNWDKLEIALLAGGFLIAIGGREFGIPLAASVGIGVVALDIALVGLEGIVTRKMKWGITTYTSETYQGIAAVSLGMILVIAGIGFGALVVAQALHSEESFLGLIFSRPGFPLLLIGGIMFLRGVASMIGALEWNESALTRFGAIFQRLGGLLLASLGFALMLLGALDILVPGAFQRLLSTATQIFLRIW